jgi:hypothetical protein
MKLVFVLLAILAALVAVHGTMIIHDHVNSTCVRLT